MDRSPTSSVATLDAPDVAEPWARHSLDEPFQLAPELTNALRRPRRQTQRVDPPRLHSRLLAALREFFDWKAIALIVLFASLGMFFFVAVAYLKVWFVFDDQLDHIRDWSPSNLTWRDRYKLRTVTRGVSIPSNATHIWANSMEFPCPDPWSCVTFQCDRKTSVKFVEAVAERPLDHFKTSYKQAIQESRFDEIWYDGKPQGPWRGRQVTDVRFVEFPESWGGVALDLSTNTVYVIRD